MLQTTYTENMYSFQTFEYTIIFLLEERVTVFHSSFQVRIGFHLFMSLVYPTQKLFDDVHLSNCTCRQSHENVQLALDNLRKFRKQGSKHV